MSVRTTARFNLAVFKNCASDWAIDKIISVEFKIGAFGLERSGGLFLNYLKYLRDTDSGNKIATTTFVAAVLDANRGELRILRYTNAAVTVESHVNTPVKTGSWYRLSATPKINGAFIDVHVVVDELYSVTQPPTDIRTRTVASITVSIAADSYGSLMGQCGLFANRSQVYFNKLTIEQS
jgi:hypothetical protein